MTEPEELNTAHLDALLDLKRHVGYGLVTERINEEIERLRTALEYPGSSDETAHRRGQIAALRTALRVPEILKGEIEKTEMI